MKKFLAVLAVLMISSSLAFAGPMLGVSFVPNQGAGAALTFGFNLASVNLEISKADLRTTAGRWGTALLWTPQQDNFGYRAGVRVGMDYNLGPANSLVYSQLEFIVGISNTWGPIQLYGDINFQPFGALRVVPIIGVNILFSELIPGDDGV